MDAWFYRRPTPEQEAWRGRAAGLAFCVEHGVVDIDAQIALAAQNVAEPLALDAASDAFDHGYLDGLRDGRPRAAARDVMATVLGR